MQTGDVFDPQWGWRSRRWLEKKRKQSLRKNPKVYIETEDGLKELNEDDYLLMGEDDWGEYSSYNYDFNANLGTKEKEGEAKRETPWEQYQRTGVWKGYEYYKPILIDYSYIVQMANLFGAEHNVDVEIGDSWKMDIRRKKLVYNPSTLMYGTKAEVIVILLHEIGHLRYTTPPDEIKKGKISSKYPDGAFLVLNAYEDLRIDNIMCNAFTTAAEIYETNKKVIERVADKSEKDAQRMIMNTKRLIDIIRNIRENGHNVSDQALQQFCAEQQLQIDKVKELIAMPKEKFEGDIVPRLMKPFEAGNIYDYMLGVMVHGNDLKPRFLPTRIAEMIKQTNKSIMESKDCRTSQQLLDSLEADVFPVIEDLLKTFQDKLDLIKEILGDALAMMMQGKKKDSKPGDPELRLPNGAGGNNTPKEWFDGDYNVLKNSVDTSIKELTRKLRNIRAKDLLATWERNLKRGRLDSKSLYRIASNRYDVFKKKIINKDRTKEFAFGISIDTSGSMTGSERIVNATRGAIILAEVFKNLDIPCEISTFDDYFKVIKPLSGKFDQKVKAKIGGIVKSSGGGTSMEKIFQESKLIYEPRKNKYMIVLTDGGANYPEETHTEVVKWAKKGVQTIGINLERSDYLSEIIPDTMSVREANKIPETFAEILRKVIKKLK